MKGETIHWKRLKRQINQSYCMDFIIKHTGNSEYCRYLMILRNYCWKNFKLANKITHDNGVIIMEKSLSFRDSY